ncbi:MAG: dephospho-CoA kinase [Cellvibrionaceae bacterium]
MTFVLGVTGGIGSGKTTATDHFETHGITVIDADVIARNIVEPNSVALAKIAEHFGNSVLQKNNGSNENKLNREKLRKIIFDQPKEKEWLENLLHPIVREKITDSLQQDTTNDYIILSAPLLLDTDLHTITDRVLVIDCDKEKQLARAGSRDNNTAAEIKKIIEKQISRTERIRRADDVITNNGSIDDLYRAVDQYHEKLLKKIRKKEIQTKQ